MHIIRSVFGNDHLSLLRPMIIDTFLADATFEWLEVGLKKSRGILLT